MQHGTTIFHQKVQACPCLRGSRACFLAFGLLDERRFGSGAKRYSKDLFGDPGLRVRALCQ